MAQVPHKTDQDIDDIWRGLITNILGHGEFQENLRGRNKAIFGVNFKIDAKVIPSATLLVLRN